VQYWLVMRNSIAQQTQVVEYSVCIFPEERRRRVYEYLTQDRAPKVIFILPSHVVGYVRNGRRYFSEIDDGSYKWQPEAFLAPGCYRACRYFRPLVRG
jgi:hypothetical protein